MQVFYIWEYLGVTPAEFFEEGKRYSGEYQEFPRSTNPGLYSEQLNSLLQSNIISHVFY
mgnify:CR=1 FL=1